MSEPSIDPTLCYVLTADAASDYAIMLFLSASALRRLYPHGRICLLTTESSVRIILGAVPELASVLSDTRTIDVPAQLTAMQASRYLKTILRSVFSGPVIYLDVDTLPVRPFVADFLLTTCDLGIAVNLSDACPYPYFPAHAVPLYTALGWPYPTRRYFNGGVVGWNDTPAARQVATEWHCRWKRTFSQGCALDQPALNSAIDAVRPNVRILPRSCNAMVDASPWLAFGAKILHFYTQGGKAQEGTVLSALVKRFEQTRQVDWPLIDGARRGRVWTKAPGARKWLRGIAPLRKAWHLLSGTGTVIR